MARDMTEKALLQNVINIARALKYGWYHTFDSRRSESGFPDLVLVGHGRVIFAELKTERGRLSDAQVRWGQSLLATGARFYLWQPRDLISGAIERALR
jgi:hypothetical protein